MEIKTINDQEPEFFLCGFFWKPQGVEVRFTQKDGGYPHLSGGIFWC